MRSFGPLIPRKTQTPTNWSPASLSVSSLSLSLSLSLSQTLSHPIPINLIMKDKFPRNCMHFLSNYYCMSPNIPHFLAIPPFFWKVFLKVQIFFPEMLVLLTKAKLFQHLELRGILSAAKIGMYITKFITNSWWILSTTPIFNFINNI